MSLLFDTGPTMSDEEFELIRDAVNRHSGMSFGQDAKYILERRLRERIQSLGLHDYLEYYRLLCLDQGAESEISQASELLTTNETYFFREIYQLEAFENEVLPDLAARNADRKRLTIWSAGCSTGEEVYSIAMLIASKPIFESWEVRVFGSDISKKVLNHARRATYRESSFRAMPLRFMRYFEDVPGGKAVRSEIRKMCHFGHLNLMEANKANVVGVVDAVFCRNVLIYFDPASRKQVVDTFFDRTVPGGYLFLGHSESLLRTPTAYNVVHLKSDMVYRRPEYPNKEATK